MAIAELPEKLTIDSARTPTQRSRSCATHVVASPRSTTTRASVRNANATRQNATCIGPTAATAGLPAGDKDPQRNEPTTTAAQLRQTPPVFAPDATRLILTLRTPIVPPP